VLLPHKAFANPAEQSIIMFRQLSTTEGLSNNSITALCRDSRGFLWIGTASGLNRYDSYTFQQYYQDSDNLPDNGVTDIFEDRTGNIWVETSQGYAIYDYQTGKFSQNATEILARFNITCDTLLHAGTVPNKKYLWAFDQNRIHLHDYQQNITKIYPLVNASLTRVYVTDEYIYSIYNNGKLYSTNINSALTQEITIPAPYHRYLEKHFPRVHIDSNGGIWVYTYQNSLLLYKKNLNDEWKEVKLPVHIEQFNRIRNMAEDAHGNIWLITSHLGAFIYRPQSDVLTRLAYDPLESHTIASNNLSALHIDTEGIVWIGNFKHGISYYVPQSQVFLNQKFWQYSDILSFCEDASYMWYGTDGGGLMRQSRTATMPEQVLTPANVIVTLMKDSKGRLWIGSFQNGLICYENGKTTQYTTENSELGGDDVYGIQEDRQGYIWISTLDGFIQKLDTKTRKFQTILDMQNRLNINELLYNDDHTLYAATSQGLLKVDAHTHECNFVYSNLQNSQTLKKQHLYTLYKDSRNYLWLGGTQGLTCWNPDTDSIFYMDHHNGLPANMVTAIEEDNNKQIWVGTCNGMARINLAQNLLSVTTYDVTDGLTDNTVNERALYKLRNGNILVGTPNGYTNVIPQEIVRNTYNAEVYFTGITPDYYPLSEMLNGKSPECATEVVLKQGNLLFQLHFSTLDFIEPGKVRYAYRIKGEQSDWSYATANQIDFSMLHHGKYELQVRACNSEYIWSPNIKTLTLRILPPWYYTWWAYLLYLLVAALIVWRNIAYFRSKQARAASLKAIRQENERSRKITDMKMQFFANVSHELRTPLSLIINPLEEFLTQYPQYKNTLLYTAQNNARYLLELINQLLDFRKLDASGESMHYIHSDIVALVKDQYQAFENMAHEREISYRITSQQSDIQMDFDYDKVRKIVMNILSNAFKFTGNKGSIEITVSIVGSNVVMQFSDTGCGIDAAEQKKIFQCFYQAENQENSQGGSGIGLYLVAQYVKMHKGNIQVSTNIPHGSIFTISLPMHANQPQQTQESPVEGNHEETVQTTYNEQNYAILLVDDNRDFLDFLSACLSTNYNVLKATNGEEALEILKTDNVDIVISDVMMPQMNGLELCTAIKNDIYTSHIPIILLTAKASEEYQLEGLNMGADDYITKPFNMEVLKLRISKFIESNLKKHKLFDEQIKIEPSRITITPLDQQFVEKAILIVEENIHNAEFSVEELATQLNISRGYLYKKMVKITGKTSLEFIRIIRMKRAQQLLTESQLQIAEIAYKLGYNSPKIFTKHFKKEFRMNPSEFVSQQAQKEDK
jgi:signal transduction histidine kinase/ligand-binding sensor domain-containing protein/DNA-binding response OmpR family regulator